MISLTCTHKQLSHAPHLCLLGGGCCLLRHALLDLRDLVPVVGMVGVVGLQEVELGIPRLVDTNAVLELQSCTTQTKLVNQERG